MSTALGSGWSGLAPKNANWGGRKDMGKWSDCGPEWDKWAPLWFGYSRSIYLTTSGNAGWGTCLGGPILIRNIWQLGLRRGKTKRHNSGHRESCSLRDEVGFTHLSKLSFLNLHKHGHNGALSFALVLRFVTQPISTAFIHSSATSKRYAIWL